MAKKKNQDKQKERTENEIHSLKSNAEEVNFLKLKAPLKSF